MTQLQRLDSNHFELKQLLGVIAIAKIISSLLIGWTRMIKGG